MNIKLPMLKNSENKESASFTMAFIAFNLVSLWLLLTIFTPLFGIQTIPSFDGTASMLYLGPILANYFGSKYITGTNQNVDNSNNQN